MLRNIGACSRKQRRLERWNPYRSRLCVLCVRILYRTKSWKAVLRRLRR